VPKPKPVRIRTLPLAGIVEARGPLYRPLPNASAIHMHGAHKRDGAGSGSGSGNGHTHTHTHTHTHILIRIRILILWVILL
jgi:hypothetical protein